MTHQELPKYICYILLVGFILQSLVIYYVGFITVMRDRIRKQRYKNYKEAIESNYEERKLPSGKLTYIQSFSVIVPMNELETVGEILDLSMFGEYCPDNSLRGYTLQWLLQHPNNYMPNIIYEMGTNYKYEHLQY